MNEEKLLEIEIEPGMKDGQEYPFISEGIEAIGFMSLYLFIFLQVSPILMVSQEILYSQCAKKSKPCL